MSYEEKLQKIEEAIGNDQKINILYLKSDDSKSQRVLVPHLIGEMEFMGKTYTGLEAYCELRQETRVFRIDRILELNVVD